MPVNGNIHGEQIPDFKDIIARCKHELDVKFEHYGNSWMNEPDGYWRKRMYNELNEFANALTEVAAKRKLLNLINMAAMTYETYKIPVKCETCGK